MNAIVLQYVSILITAVTSPVSLSYVGLAAVHAVAARYYLKHDGGVPLALCAGLASALYVLLAYLHAFTH